jgi:hypothetical protein
MDLRTIWEGTRRHLGQKSISLAARGWEVISVIGFSRSALGKLEAAKIDALRDVAPPEDDEAGFEFFPIGDKGPRYAPLCKIRADRRRKCLTCNSCAGSVWIYIDEFTALS